MTEPVTTVLGLKVGTSVAGFAGSIVSLAFLKNLTRTQAVSAVVVGTLSAAYLTPVVAERLSMSPEMANGTGFVIGLCAMGVIPGVKAVFSAQNVRLLVARFLGISTSQPTQGEGDAK